MKDEGQQTCSFDDLSKKEQDNAIRKNALLGVSDGQWHKPIFEEYRTVGEILGISIAECSVEVPTAPDPKLPPCKIVGKFDTSRIRLGYTPEEEFASLAESASYIKGFIYELGKKYRISVAFHLEGTLSLQLWLLEEEEIIEPKSRMSRAQYQSYLQGAAQVQSFVGEFLDSLRDKWYAEYQSRISRKYIQSLLKSKSFDSKGAIVDSE